MAIDKADWHWDSAEKTYRKKHNITGELTEEQIKTFGCMLQIISAYLSNG